MRAAHRPGSGRRAGGAVVLISREHARVAAGTWENGGTPGGDRTSKLELTAEVAPRN